MKGADPGGRDSRRRHYRVPAPGEAPLDVRVRVETVTHAARVLDTSAGGVGLAFEGRPPALARGARVGLRFALRGSDEEPVEVLGELRHVDAGTHGFAFPRPESLYAALAAHSRASEWWAHFNRRRTLRVRPAPLETVEVVLGGGGVSARGRLVDLCFEGLRADIEAERGEELCAARSPTAVLRLGGPVEEPVHVRVTFVHRIELGARWHLGLEFDQERTPRWGDASIRIGRYVTTCQTRPLRRP